MWSLSWLLWRAIYDKMTPSPLTDGGDGRFDIVSDNQIDGQKAKIRPLSFDVSLHLSPSLIVLLDGSVYSSIIPYCEQLPHERATRAVHPLRCNRVCWWTFRFIAGVSGLFVDTPGSVFEFEWPLAKNSIYFSICHADCKLNDAAFHVTASNNIQPIIGWWRALCSERWLLSRLLKFPMTMQSLRQSWRWVLGVLSCKRKTWHIPLNALRSS